MPKRQLIAAGFSQTMATLLEELKLEEMTRDAAFRRRAHAGPEPARAQWPDRDYCLMIFMSRGGWHAARVDTATG
jgi:hypothetical protein